MVARLPALRELSLYELPELDLADAFRKLSAAPQLAKLDFQADALPDEVGLLTRLRRLHVYPYVRSEEQQRPLRLSPALGTLPMLEELSLHGQHLEELPGWLCELPRLETLLLGDNRLSRIPDAIARLPRLRQLSLRGNPLPPAERARLERLLPDVEVGVDSDPDPDQE